MTWDTVPWMVEGGVKHSTNVTRLLSYVAFAGREGVIDPTDLQVRERSAGPAASVRIGPGACSIINKASNASQEAYAARNPTEDTVAIAPTTGSARTDLVIARVENPFLAGEPYVEPTAQQIEDGEVQFVFTRVIAGMAGPTPGTHPTAAQVRAALNGMSAIPLASVAMPASAATVTQARIKDQRQIAAFRSAHEMFVVNPGAQVILNDATWKVVGSASVEVPEWATHYSARAVIGGAKYNDTQSVGNLRVKLGTNTGPSTPFDETTTTPDSRAVLMAGASNEVIPTGNRGTNMTLAVEGQKTAGQNMIVGPLASVSLEIVFHSKPETT